MLVQKRTAKEISLSERHRIIEDYLISSKSKVEIWRKYTGQREEHGQILRWMRMYGYSDKNKKINLGSVMSRDNSISDDNLDTAQLKQRIKELENALEYSELKATAYCTMIDVAEQELNISIRKK